jgi:hypothetical protein
MGRIFALLILVVVTTSGCPFNLADVRFLPTEMQASAKSERTFALAKEVEISQLPCGYSRTLRNGTRWDLVGELPKGAIYRSKDQSLTLECSNVYEAYLVIEEDSLVGFYLPVEKGFVRVSDPIRLPIKK